MIVSRPDLSHQEAFLRMLEDYLQHDPENGEYYLRGKDDFPAYIKYLADDEQGLNLSVGRVPQSHRWLLDDAGSIVGIVRIRHNINTRFLAEEAGHIGYDVPPSQRGKGYGIACLQAGLEVARQLQLEQVLVCADTDNPASWKTIEHCGGILQFEKFSDHYQTMVRHYRIKTGI
jgi:predicted acetyltransferase